MGAFCCRVLAIKRVIVPYKYNVRLIVKIPVFERWQIDIGQRTGRRLIETIALPSKVIL